MIHIATIHWKYDDFVDIQIEFIEKCIPNARIWAFLDSMDNLESNLGKHFYSADSQIQPPGDPHPRHAEKFEALAQLIINHEETDDSDIIIFMDGDAWPIKPLEMYMREALENTPLGAIIREENAGDQQPHPCFCFTTVGFWKHRKLRWSVDRVDSKSFPRRVDIGGWLLQYMKSKKIEWHKMRRSAGLRDHPVFYGIYAERIYHHGAGYRTPKTMDDLVNKRRVKTREEHVLDLDVLIQELETHA